MDLVPRIESYINSREKLQSLSQLAESEAKFTATFNQAAVGMAHVSLDGTFLLLNQKFGEIIGYSADEIRELHFQDITHPDDQKMDQQHHEAILSGAIQNYSYEKRYIRKDRSVVWVNLTVSLVRNVSGTPSYIIGVIEDINARKQDRKSVV